MGVRIKELSNYLVKAEERGEGVQPLTELYPDLDVKEAYNIQLEIINRKVEAGQRIVGKKIGLTSRAMQELLGVDEPDYGHLLDSMVVENDGEIFLGRLLQPKVEGEIAFVLKEDLRGPGVKTEDVLQATEYVLPALEIVDSRIANWQIKLEDTVADNASSGLYVLGGHPVKVDQVELPEIKMELYKNGEIVNSGKGSAALGDPAYCVAWLANKLSEFNIVLKEGEVILSGALSAAVDAKSGDKFSARLDHLGTVSATFR